MRGKLQQTYRAAQELERQSAFGGSIPLGEMPRLASLLMSDEGSVEVEFEFTRGNYQHDAIRGRYRAGLTTQCQRCLDPMTLAVEQSFELLIDASDEDVEAFQVDTVYTDDGHLNVFEVIEDELILALPLIMMHENVDCNRYLSKPVHDDAPAEERPNPFAVLASLKEPN